jgi:hypothetical protein
VRPNWEHNPFETSLAQGVRVAVTTLLGVATAPRRSLNSPTKNIKPVFPFSILIHSRTGTTGLAVPLSSIPLGSTPTRRRASRRLRPSSIPATTISNRRGAWPSRLSAPYHRDLGQDVAHTAKAGWSTFFNKITQLLRVGARFHPIRATDRAFSYDASGGA